MNNMLERISSQHIADVLEERNRQILELGWSREHDDTYHADGSLAFAASVLADVAAIQHIHHRATGKDLKIYPVEEAPWPEDWTFKPADTRRQLVKAGALILAEIERLDRAAVRK
jgi:hypothetical protein